MCMVFQYIQFLSPRINSNEWLFHVGVGVGVCLILCVTLPTYVCVRAGQIDAGIREHGVVHHPEYDHD